MNNVTEFTKKKPTSTEDKSKIYRVIDITSPFFSWEGWFCNKIIVNEGFPMQREFIQIQCTHHGFYFPYFTFAKEQLIEV